MISIFKPWRRETANHFRNACERQSCFAKVEKIAGNGRLRSKNEQDISWDKVQQDEEKRAANNQEFCRHAGYQRKSDLSQNLPLLRNAQRRTIIVPLTENNKAQQTSSWTFINISSIAFSFSIKFSTPILLSFLCPKKYCSTVDIASTVISASNTLYKNNTLAAVFYTQSRSEAY